MTLFEFFFFFGYFSQRALNQIRAIQKRVIQEQTVYLIRVISRTFSLLFIIFLGCVTETMQIKHVYEEKALYIVRCGKPKRLKSKTCTVPSRYTRVQLMQCRLG